MNVCTAGERKEKATPHEKGGDVMKCVICLVMLRLENVH